MTHRFTRREFFRKAGLLAFLPPLIPAAGFFRGAPKPPDDDASICLKKFAEAVDNTVAEQPIGSVVASVGRSFVGTDYEAGVLDTAGTERLIVNLHGLDCVTLCENSLALARCIRLGETTYGSFCAQLQLIRYRGGIIDGYPSRLHYFSDWIYDNARKKVVSDVTSEVGGSAAVTGPRPIDFMTNHRSAYRQLADDAFAEAIRKQEEEISSRPLTSIPKDAVRSVERNIRHGDIIAITTNIPGMDVSHTGIAFRTGDGTMHLLHAPVPGSNVRITEAGLADYLANNAKQTGIIIARPLEPK